MKKIKRMLKRVVAAFATLLLCINSFAAIVSDNDGSAFITKAEFDSLKNSFQAQIDTYNTSIDAKIDGAIAAYLAGIRTAAKIELETLYNKWKVGTGNIQWINGTDINLTGITDEEKYGLVTTEAFCEYQKFGVSSNRVENRSPAFGSKNFSKTTNTTTRMIRNDKGYYYYGKVDGKYTVLSTMQWDYTQDNSWHGPLAPCPSPRENFSTLTGSNKKSYATVFLPAYYSGCETWANGLSYPEATDYTYKIAPRKTTNEYVCDLLNERGVKTSSTSDGSVNHAPWKNSGYSGGIRNNIYGVWTQWLNYPIAPSNLKSKKIKDMLNIDWYQKDGLPLYDSVPAKATYTLSVKVPAAGWIYFYDYTNNKITNWTTLYTTITSDTKYSIAANTSKNFTCDANKGDMLAIVYIPNSTTTAYTITEHNLSYSTE